MAKGNLFTRKPKRFEIDGEVYFVRSLTLREATTAADLKKTESYRYSLSRCVLNEDGSRVFSDDDPQIDDIGIDLLAELMAVVLKASNPTKPETIAGN